MARKYNLDGSYTQAVKPDSTSTPPVVNISIGDSELGVVVTVVDTVDVSSSKEGLLTLLLFLILAVVIWAVVMLQRRIQAH